MTTITIKSPVSLSQTEFENIEEAVTVLLEELKQYKKEQKQTFKEEEFDEMIDSAITSPKMKASLTALHNVAKNA